MNDAKPSAITFVTSSKYHHYNRWRLSKERTTAEGIASSIAFLAAGKFKTINRTENGLDAKQSTMNAVEHAHGGRRHHLCRRGTRAVPVMA